MNWNWIEGGWEQLKGRARETWARLIGESRRIAAGKEDPTVGALRARAGELQDRAERTGGDLRRASFRPGSPTAPGMTGGWHCSAWAPD